MHLMKSGLLVAASFLSLFSFEVQAQPLCTTESTAAACLCQGEPVEEAVYLQDFRAQAIAIRKGLCLGTATGSEIYQALFDLVLTQRGIWFAPFGGFEDGKDPLDPILEALQTSSADNFRVPNASFNLFDQIVVDGQIYQVAQPDQCPDDNCLPVYSEFKEYYNYAHTTLAAEGALRFARSVSGLSSQWDRYLSQSRSQTPLELLINSKYFKPKDDQQFFAPPDRQIIFLHPALMIENVNDAIDGEQTIEALMIELVGFDRWRKSDWYKPSGASIIASYSDRPGVEDTGFGIAVHFRSLYTIGYTNHDGADGILFSFDLLKLLVDKRETFDALTQ